MRHKLALSVLLLAPGIASAHVGAVIAKAVFCSPPPPIEPAAPGMAWSYSPAEADTHYMLAWQDGDTDPTGKLTFYYIDHQVPSALDADGVEMQATVVHTVDGRDARDVYVSCACVAQVSGQDTCNTGTLPGCSDGGARWCDNYVDWDTSQVPDGVYWIMAVNNDPPYHVYNTALAPVRVAHGADPKPPIVMVTKPDGLGPGADTQYEVHTLVVGQPPVTLDYAYGVNDLPVVNDPLHRIAQGQPATAGADGTVAYVWDVSGLKNQVYFVSVSATDATGLSTFSDSRFGLSVFHRPDAATDVDGGDDLATSTDDASVPDLGTTPEPKSCNCSLGRRPSGGAPTALFALMIIALALLRRR
jgi:MYXO-CTERM domain-containing protein